MTAAAENQRRIAPTLRHVHVDRPACAEYARVGVHTPANGQGDIRGDGYGERACAGAGGPQLEVIPAKGQGNGAAAGYLDGVVSAEHGAHRGRGIPACPVPGVVCGSRGTRKRTDNKAKNGQTYHTVTDNAVCAAHTLPPPDAEDGCHFSDCFTLCQDEEKVKQVGRASSRRERGAVTLPYAAHWTGGPNSAIM